MQNIEKNLLTSKFMTSETAQGQDYFKLGEEFENLRGETRLDFLNHKQDITQIRQEIRKLAEAFERFQKDINLRLRKLEIEYDARHKV